MFRWGKLNKYDLKLICNCSAARPYVQTARGKNRLFYLTTQMKKSVFEGFSFALDLLGGFWEHPNQLHNSRNSVLLHSFVSSRSSSTSQAAAGYYIEQKKSCSAVRVDFHLFLIQGTCSLFPPSPSLPSCLSVSFMSIRDSVLPDLIGLTFPLNRTPSEGRRAALRGPPDRGGIPLALGRARACLRSRAQ